MTATVANFTALWSFCAGQVPKCTSEGFMRTVAGIKRNGKDVRRTIHQHLSGFAQATTTHVECEATTRGSTECAGVVIT
jgi:hypothetical protein